MENKLNLLTDREGWEYFLVSFSFSSAVIFAVDTIIISFLLLLLLWRAVLTLSF